MEQLFILSLSCMLSGVILIYIGMNTLLAKVIGRVKIKLPIVGWEVDTDVPAVGILGLGTFLIFFPLYKWPSDFQHEVIRISGQITTQGRSSHEGTMLGVLPGRYTTFTDSQGNFTFDVFAGEASYTGIAYLRDGDTRLTHIRGIVIKESKGSFNHEFER